MIHNFFLTPVPVHFLAFGVSARGHDGRDGMPETRPDMSVRHRVTRAHAADPVVQVRLAVVAQVRGWQLPVASGNGHQLGFALPHHFTQTFESVEGILPDLLGNEKPTRAAFPALRIERAFLPANTGVVAKTVAIAGGEGTQQASLVKARQTL